MIDERTPVIVGVGQASQRFAEADRAEEPIALLAGAVREAEHDASARRTPLREVDTVAVVDMLSWKYPDPGALLARTLGIEPKATVLSTVGGNSPQLLLNELAGDIARGERRVVLLGGAECMYARRRARKEPRVWLEWSKPADPACPTIVGDPRPGTTDEELAHRAVMPTDIYPLFETALRAETARGIAEHQAVIGELWSGFSAVAAANPDAWNRTAYSPGAIATVSADNRAVAFPYLKRMCANLDVDQAAAIILCSYGTARELGVPEEKLVFPLAGADAHDHFHVTHRWSLTESPAIGAIGRATLKVLHLDIDDVARFDLYSCFPSAVQLALRALGLRGLAGGDARPLTTTGGLAFAGGPGNNYSTHGVATMVAACRADPGSIGLVTALGWYATKHSIGCYSTAPPPDGFRRVAPSETQAVVDAGRRRESAGPYTGPATLEATSVLFGRDGAPTIAIVTALTSDGRRVWANADDRELLTSMTVEPWEGRPVRIVGAGSTNMLAV